MENRRKPKSGDGGYKSKLATRSGARLYLAKEYLREADRDLKLARRLKKDTNSAGPSDYLKLKLICQAIRGRGAKKGQGGGANSPTYVRLLPKVGKIWSGQRA